MPNTLFSNLTMTSQAAAQSSVVPVLMGGYGGGVQFQQNAGNPISQPSSNTNTGSPVSQGSPTTTTTPATDTTSTTVPTSTTTPTNTNTVLPTPATAKKALTDEWWFWAAVAVATAGTVYFIIKSTRK